MKQEVIDAFNVKIAKKLFSYRWHNISPHTLRFKKLVLDDFINDKRKGGHSKKTHTPVVAFKEKVEI
ncbi:MAG: hypothetical protein ACI9CD_000596 [Candidatus Deianiraeaceae bacterium]